MLVTLVFLWIAKKDKIAATTINEINLRLVRYRFLDVRAWAFFLKIDISKCG